MDRRAQLGEFLRSRRGRVQPHDVGLEVAPEGRRVKGLRRGELAHMAGISVDYYVRLEQGRVRNVSEQVLDSLALALRLDEVERDHLHVLVHRRAISRRTRLTATRRAPASVRAVVHALEPMPALAHNLQFDVLCLNRAASILFDGVDDGPVGRRNLARWVYTDARAREVLLTWSRVAADVASVLRTATVTYEPGDDVRALVGELSASAPEFVRSWGEHRPGVPSEDRTTPVRHPVVGDVELICRSLSTPAQPDVYVSVYTAPPGSRAAEQLDRLALTRGVESSVRG